MIDMSDQFDRINDKLGSDDLDEVRASINQLAELPSFLTAAPLTQLLEEYEPLLRDAAYNALKKYGFDVFVYLVDLMPERTRQAQSLMNKLISEYAATLKIDEIVEKLDHPDARIRFVFAKALPGRVNDFSVEQIHKCVALSEEEVDPAISTLYELYWSALKSKESQLSAEELDKILPAKDSVELKTDAVQHRDIDASSIPEAQPVHFTLYNPTEAIAETQSSIVFYTHLDEMMDSVASDVKKFAEELGDKPPEMRRSRSHTMIAPGTELTVSIEADDLDIQPQSQTKTWKGSHFLRFIFEFSADKDLVGELVTIRASVRIGGIEVGHVNGALGIVEVKQYETVTNTLALAKMKDNTGELYKNVFISYSRRDKAIAENYRLVQIAMGNDVFMDTYSIRTGESWQASLANAIDSAEIFQLFWSEHSANSPNVRDEWEYALKYRCKGNDCGGFLRPVFWKHPMADIPEELGYLNFKFVPLGNVSGL
jgi:hypothetical protein